MSDVASGVIKRFIFRSKSKNNGVTLGDIDSKRDRDREYLEIQIPELLQPSYSFYTWPCAPVLAWFLWHNRRDICGKKVLEIGAGTALPGILAAKCGALVTLTDSRTLPKSLAHIHKCCQVNGLTPGKDLQVTGLTWGLFLQDIFTIGPFDLIISSDSFYDPIVFEDIIVTVALLLEQNNCKFYCTYQERSSDWSIEPLLKKWDLKCNLIDLKAVGDQSGINFTELMGDHTIHLLEIYHC